jgi:hypothetical protein
MSEYELISLLREHVSFMIQFLQWWVGITVAILIGVHVIGRALNGYIASLLGLLYTAFTLMVTQIEKRHSERIEVIVTDLEKLVSAETPVSETTQHMLAGGGPSTQTILLGLICFWGFFISTVAYVIYCYRNVKRLS